MDGDSVAAWRGWAAEAFADTRRARWRPLFVRALSDFLITPGPGFYAGTKDYPPVTLRVALTAAVPPAAGRRGTWGGYRNRDRDGRAPRELGRRRYRGPRRASVRGLGGGLRSSPDRIQSLGMRRSEVIRFDGKRLKDHREDAQALLERRMPRTGRPHADRSHRPRLSPDPSIYQAHDVPARCCAVCATFKRREYARPPQLAPADRPALMPVPLKSCTRYSLREPSAPRTCALKTRRKVTWDA